MTPKHFLISLAILATLFAVAYMLRNPSTWDSLPWAAPQIPENDLQQLTGQGP